MGLAIFETGSTNSEGKPLILQGRDEQGFVCAELKWDGCMNLWIKGEVEEGKEAWTEAGRCEEDCDYIHLCNPIEVLEQLLVFAKAARQRMVDNGEWCGEKP